MADRALKTIKFPGIDATYTIPLITIGSELPQTAEEREIFLQTGEGSYLSRIGAAPAGYGLGEAQFFSAAEIDTLTRPGFYYNNESMTIGGFSNTRWWMEVSAYGAGSTFATQRMFIGSNQGYELTRRKVNGTWCDWEWVNPPMAMNVEYRTTERLEGKPVYVKYINYGYYTGGTALEFAHDISSVYTPISIDLTNNAQEVLTDYNNLEYVTMNRTYIYMKCGNSMGNVGFIIKYSKNVT